MTWRSVISILETTVGTILLLAAFALLGGWIIGIIGSDHWWWTQWLSWIPSLVLLPIGLLWLCGALLVPRLRRTRTWTFGPVLLLAGPLIFLTMNWRPAPLEEGQGLTITQWTLGSVLSNEDDYARALIKTGSEVCIVEGARRVRWSQPIKDWLGPEHLPPSTGIFSVMTKLPITRLRSAIWAEGIHVAILEIQGPGFEQAPLDILLVDLPSDPSRSRLEIARQLQSLLEQADTGSYDMVIGDFNMPADSSALATLFPGYTRAWTTSGEGWGPTFPRAWSVARLDHVLVSGNVQVTGLRTIDPGIGRHRLQVMRVIPREQAGSMPGSVAHE